jgi:signal transduction histidine kinase
MLTYRLTRDDGPAVVQLGRALIDQERVLNRLVLILVGLGSVSALAMGSGSWWLAGRSLLPAQQAWERQQTFVANASHELRTPLALIRTSAEAALRRLSSDTERAKRLMVDVVSECDHVTHLIEDLLLLSRLDAGRLTLERVVIALPDLLLDTVRQVQPLAEERQITVYVTDTAGAVWGDPTRLRQVVLILLDNALQHTPAGGSIQVSAQPHGQHVQVSVCDTGAGIAPEHLPHLFERFYQVDSARTSSDGKRGTGLGLSIAKLLIEVQQGHITISSTPGAGTCATLTLPAE